MKLQCERINAHVTAFPALQIDCPECKREFTILDDIDGKIFSGNVDSIFCICGAEITLKRDIPGQHTINAINTLLDNFAGKEVKSA